MSRLHLIDLAGSERAKDADTRGQTFKEGRSINTSLSHLGKVIKALADRASFIPYRDSMLTRILQSSLSACEVEGGVERKRRRRREKGEKQEAEESSRGPFELFFLSLFLSFS